MPDAAIGAVLDAATNVGDTEKEIADDVALETTGAVFDTARDAAPDVTGAAVVARGAGEKMGNDKCELRGNEIGAGVFANVNNRFIRFAPMPPTAEATLAAVVRGVTIGAAKGA